LIAYFSDKYTALICYYRKSNLFIVSINYKFNNISLFVSEELCIYLLQEANISLPF